MNSFIKTLMIGFAAMGVLLLAGGLTVLTSLRGQGVIPNKEEMRTLVLSAEEQAWLGKMHNRADESPEVPGRAETEEQMLKNLAEVVSADQAQRLVVALRHQKQSLDERQVWLDQQEAEMRLVRADLQRLRGQIDTHAVEVAKKSEEQRLEHVRWAEAAAAQVKQNKAISLAEIDRVKEQVKIFEAMKEGAWQSLRRFPPSDIALYLYVMDPKRAAKLLAVAEADQEYPDITLAINRAYRVLDINAPSEERVKSLAKIYSFLPAATVAASLRDSANQEAAELIVAIDDDKKEADVLAAIRSVDPQRETELLHVISQIPKPAVQ